MAGKLKLPFQYGFSILLVLLKGVEMLDLDQTNLKWQTFDGSLPNGAVHIQNDRRTDYVCKYGVQAGFYSPSLDPYCHYPYAEHELRITPFEILVNKDNFEILEWKDGSYGSVPQNSVYTSSNKGIYVGKNQYGLGKVHVKNEAFFLAWGGSEYWYKHYQVLTVNRDIIREHILDVKYITDGVQIIQDPPESLDTSVITNSGCQEVTGTASLEKKKQEDQRWDTSFSITTGVTTSMTAGIPDIASTTIGFSLETTFQFTTGTTISKSTTYKLSVEHTVPPNHSCSVNMVGRKHTADLPFTANVQRTYRNGRTTSTSISGTYRGVQMGEIRAEVNRCEPLPHPKPCP
ncbi:natterin-3-like [Centropristis striata]|uniref:natterin-3-like n=1 Tax=Centropristis striata TaxID=184440 RepID=UPI0027DF75F7|nr:natterin-3-like [Centropristis striata]